MTAISRGRLVSSTLTKVTSTQLAIIAFLLGVSITLAYKPFSQPVRGDVGIYDYIAQSILRGQVPYRDVIDPKAPLSMYLSAAAMAAGRPLGISDIAAVRWFNAIMAGLLLAMNFLVAEAYLKSRLAGVIAALVPLLPENFALMMTKGTQPKLPMMIFGMVTLFLIARQRPFLSGFFSMLSCLCWQPGLMFTGVAVLMYSRYLTKWNDGRALKVIAGAAVPLAALLLYFYSLGALPHLWSWTITYTYSVFRPEGQKPITQAIGLMWKIIHRELGSDLILWGLSVIGFGMFAWQRIAEKFKMHLRSSELFRDAVLIPPVVYLVFCTIDFQGGPDLIPFLPFVGVFAGWFFVELGRMIASNALIQKKLSSLEWSVVVPTAAICVMLVLLLLRTTRYKPPATDLQSQQIAIGHIADYLDPTDKIYVHGTAEILVLLNRPNLNPYIALDSGADDYIAQQRPGGFKDVLDELEAAAPKLVAISRLRNVRHGRELENWALEHYDELNVPGLDGIYIRK
jgi:hypothetical protein